MNIPAELRSKFLILGGYYIKPYMIQTTTRTGVILTDGRVFNHPEATCERHPNP